MTLMNESSIRDIATLIERNKAILAQVPLNLRSKKYKRLTEKKISELASSYNSLLEKNKNNLAIRSIHHFACSGGSLIAKCLDAMPSVRLLSELHPNARKHLHTASHKFTPSDVISCAYYAGVSDLDSLALNIMESSIKLAIEHAYSQREFLVFREHSHTDFCVGSEPSNVRFFKKIRDDIYPGISVATVRNPVDSYLSLAKNNWVHFEPSTFNEYCKRLNMFLAGFEEQEIFFYEEFLEKPLIIMESICNALDIPFSPTFVDTYDTRKITGDSGRGADSIKRLPRRELSPEYIREVNNSEEYKVFLGRFEYYKKETESLKK